MFSLKPSIKVITRVSFGGAAAVVVVVVIALAIPTSEFTTNIIEIAKAAAAFIEA